MPMAADWSSLPSELLGLVADSLLATGDVDCYMSLRAVCTSWRVATADPRGPDPRFLPRRWVMLETRRAASVHDCRRLFLNIDTGRLVWKNLPVLRDHACVATDNDGLLILQGPTGSNMFSALNPFTGASIRFPLYPAYAPSGRVVAAGSSPMVVLYSFHGNNIRQVLGLPDLNPGVQEQEYAVSVDLNFKFVSCVGFSTKPALDSLASVVRCQGRVYMMDRRGTVVVLEDRWRITTIVNGDWQEAWRPLFLVDNAGELLVVRAPTFRDIVQVFRADLENKALHMIKSIGNLAIFLGTRSLSVDTNNLPAIEANCIYYIGGGGGGGGAYELHVHCLEPRGHEELFERIDIVLPEILVCSGQRQVGPLSLPHVLMKYATYDSLTRVRLGI